MPDPAPFTGRVDGVSFLVRPEYLAGKHWWRVYVDGNPKVLVRFRDFAILAAEALAGDEARFREDGRHVQWAQDHDDE